MADAIVAEASRSAVEICGLLFGREGAVEDHQSCRNVALDAAISFEIDPQVLLAAHRSMRRGGPTIIGHYHSHPSGSARPSRRDAEQSSADGSLWLIVGAGELAAWRAASHGDLFDRFDRVALNIV